MKNKHATYFALAKVWARQSTCTSVRSVGCVLVDPSGRVVASGYNGMPSGMPHCDDVGECVNDAHIHAEANAVIQCARSGISSRGLSIYTTHAPCTKCASMLFQAGIEDVYFLKEVPGLAQTVEQFKPFGMTFWQLILTGRWNQW